ncbi:MAG TPA: glycosyltransferase family 2 protein [Streptosporangiaceae bacterium]|nr:glycosyltransferase family 2 protein [Streptosporangiaceae bacterium]
MTTTRDDRAIDEAALSAFAQAYGDRARRLPPVAFVIAAYNEEGAIGPVVEALPQVLCGLETVAIVVADGCADATAKEADAAGALVCDVPVNRGQGAALRLGYRIAREGGAAYIVTTDADGQYNPADAERLLSPILAGDADFVTGSRQMGSQETRDPIRRMGVRFFAAMASVLTGQQITDTTFGLRAMRAEVTGAVRLEQPQYQAAELLIGVISRGYRVREVPATIRRRRVGESKKGQNPLYSLHLPGVNNFFYGLHFSRVIMRTWWRERQRGPRDPHGSLAPPPGSGTGGASAAKNGSVPAAANGHSPAGTNRSSPAGTAVSSRLPAEAGEAGDGTASVRTDRPGRDPGRPAAPADAEGPAGRAKRT